MLKLEQLGCAEPVVGMVMPAGYTFNADGTAIYLSMGAIFIAQATNTPPRPARTDHASCWSSCSHRKVRPESPARALSRWPPRLPRCTPFRRRLVLLLGVERLTNVPRAVVNVIGSSVATIVIAKWENAFDSERSQIDLQRQL